MLLVIEIIYGVLIVYQAIYFVLYRNDLISLSPTLRKVLFDQLQKRRDGFREVKHSLMTAKRGAGLGAGCLWLRRSAPGAAGLDLPSEPIGFFQHGLFCLAF